MKILHKRMRSVLLAMILLASLFLSGCVEPKNKKELSAKEISNIMTEGRTVTAVCYRGEVEAPYEANYLPLFIGEFLLGEPVFSQGKMVELPVFAGEVTKEGLGVSPSFPDLQSGTSFYTGFICEDSICWLGEVPEVYMTLSLQENGKFLREIQNHSGIFLETGSNYVVLRKSPDGKKELVLQEEAATADSDTLYISPNTEKAVYFSSNLEPGNYTIASCAWNQGIWWYFTFDIEIYSEKTPSGEANNALADEIAKLLSNQILNTPGEGLHHVLTLGKFYGEMDSSNLLERNITWVPLQIDPEYLEDLQKAPGNAAEIAASDLLSFSVRSKKESDRSEAGGDLPEEAASQKIWLPVYSGEILSGLSTMDHSHLLRKLSLASVLSYYFGARSGSEIYWSRDESPEVYMTIYQNDADEWICRIENKTETRLQLMHAYELQRKTEAGWEKFTEGGRNYSYILPANEGEEMALGNLAAGTYRIYGLAEDVSEDGLIYLLGAEFIVKK